MSLDFPTTSRDYGPMAKSLIITEKPSVARDIVAALGGFTAHGKQDYWESDAYICTYAVGHILQLLEPEDIDPSFKAWRLGSLPIIPQTFQLKAVSGHERRLKVISTLAKRPDVSCLINACDAAREGELIFREIAAFTGCRKWVRRLWLQSMTPEAIRHGFTSLRDGTDLDGLGAAAECRSRADWLIGMNATRAFSLRLRSGDERTPWSVGRVQTPTLALLVARELKIVGHLAQPYWRLMATFQAQDHSYEGVLFDPSFKANEAHPERKDDRYFDRSTLEAAARGVQGRVGEASETREESLRHAPYLFHLTGLQKYMSTRYKWTAKRTLEAAQRCYEQHKVLTYPRTNSTCLPSDYRGEVDRLIRVFAGDDTYGPHAGTLLKEGLRNTSRTFNDKGVDDHFAIIPTGKSRALSGDDAKVFDAVVRRFLATFFPPAVYDKVRRITKVAEHSFRTGPLETLSVPGWMAVYDREAEASDSETKGKPSKLLPPLRAGQKSSVGVKVKTQTAEIKEEKTKPPPRLTEAGLLGMMEFAGRQVEDEQLASALMSAEGLGTAATRADIIQNLKAKQYVDETLRPTLKGIRLIQTLEIIKAQRLTSPELTARLELQLAEVEKSKFSPARFMQEIAQYVTDVVEIARAFDVDKALHALPVLGPCPGCQGGEIKERMLTYDCTPIPGLRPSCGFRIYKEVHGRYMDRSLVAHLLQYRSTPELDGFRDLAGRDFRATLRVENGRVMIDGSGATGSVPDSPPVQEARTSRRYGQAGGYSRSGATGAGTAKPAYARTKTSKTGTHRNGARGAAPATPAASSPRESVGPCPVHGPDCQVIETRGAYLCEKRLAAFQDGDKNPVGFWLPKILCRRDLSLEDAKTYLNTKETPLLDGFVSKTGRPFKASLKMEHDGSFTFIFPERGPHSSFAKESGRQK